MNRAKAPLRSTLILGALFIIISTFLLPVHSAAFGQPYIFERSFGTIGTGPGQFEQITALAQDSHGNYIILDGSAGEYQICTHDGVCTEHDTVAKVEGQLGGQAGLAINSKDEIFITNQYYGKVEKCLPGGSCEVFLTEHDGLGIQPGAIAIDAHDRIYITDENSGRGHIIVCDSAGSCSSFGSWGSNLGQFSDPCGLAINSRGQVVIFDSSNPRIQTCDHQGNCEYASYDHSYYSYCGLNDGQGIALMPSDTMIITGNGEPDVGACTLGGACRKVAWYNYSDGTFNPDNPASVMVTNNDRLVIGGYGAVHFLAPNVSVNPGINDAWIEPGVPGQGLLISVFEDIKVMFVAWFTYEATRPAGFPEPEIGEWGHRWITLQGSFSGDVANLNIYLTQGGEFESKTTQPDDAVKIGEATLTLHNCYSATLIYNIDGTDFQGTKNLVRIVADNVPNCQILSGS